MNNIMNKLEQKEYLEKLRPVESNSLLLTYDKIVKGANIRYKVKAKKRYVPKTHYSLLARNEREFNRHGEIYFKKNTFNELTEVCTVDDAHNLNFQKTEKVGIIKKIEKVKAEICLPKSILSGGANKLLTNCLYAKGISHIDVMAKLKKEGKAIYSINAKVGNFGKTIYGTPLDNLILKIFIVDKVCFDDKGNFSHYIFRNNHDFKVLQFAMEERDEQVRTRQESAK